MAQSGIGGSDVDQKWIRVGLGVDDIPCNS